MRKFQPIELSDDVAFDLSLHGYSIEELSAFFNIPKGILLERHGEAVRLGQLEARRLPRSLLMRIFTEYSKLDSKTFLNPQQLGALVKALDLFARKYEGMTAVSETSAPSITSMTFSPLVENAQ